MDGEYPTASSAVRAAVAGREALLQELERAVTKLRLKVANVARSTAAPSRRPGVPSAWE
jgi:Arc/MetJ-type ribon-helix-helix transcriptional regulator